MAKKTKDPKTDVVEEKATTEEATEQTPECPEKSVVDALIRKRVYAAIGIGFIPVPLVDFAGLTALQLEMIYALSKAHGVEFKKERVKSILSSLGGGVFTTASVPLAASLFKAIPVIGMTAGAASISIMGGATTYGLGWVFDRHFRNGGTLKNFDTEGTKAYFKTKVEEGKNFVSKIKKGKKEEASTEEPAATTA